MNFPHVVPALKAHNAVAAIVEMYADLVRSYEQTVQGLAAELVKLRAENAKLRGDRQDQTRSPGTERKRETPVETQPVEEGGQGEISRGGSFQAHEGVVETPLIDVFGRRRG